MRARSRRPEIALCQDYGATEGPPIVSTLNHVVAAIAS
jgi:hypothetical protein